MTEPCRHRRDDEGANDEDRRRSKEAGFDYYLVKPIDISAVEELLASPTRAQAVT